jgi:hypothetical protein
MSLVKAQGILEINERRIVKADETLTINAGTLIKMGPGAILDVRGSLKIKGTAENPVRISNVNPEIPAMGIQISGILETGKIEISGVEFDGLIQPLRFDPFWYRKNVIITAIKIKNSASFEPIVYLASPFIDLREGRKINLEFNDVSVVNNSSGILVESFGSNGIKHVFNKLYFADNNLSGGDVSLGLLHLDFSTNNSNESLDLGEIAFERNLAGNSPIGLSVSGSSKQSVKVRGLFGEDPLNVVFDQKRDLRVPAVEVSRVGSLSEFGKADYIKSIEHNYGDVKFEFLGEVVVNEFLDEEGEPVEVTKTVNSDTTHFNYIQGKPTVAVLSDGRRIKLPEVLPINKPDVKVTKIDTAEFNNFKKLSSQVNKYRDSSDKVEVQFGFTIPTFAKKGEIVNKHRLWEIGIWGGGAIYGGGDLEHRTALDYPSALDVVKNTPVLRDIPVFSTLEASFGLYGQYNWNGRFSLRGTYYNSKISTWNVIAPGLFSRTRDIQTFDADFETVSFSSRYNWFVTQMNNLEIEGLWHLVPYELKKGKKYRIIPTLGLSLGAIHYTPYRYTWAPSFPGEKWEDYKFNPTKHNLRKLGSEGQNFLPGAKPYGIFAGSVGTSFQLAYLRKKWALKGEMKFVYTSTDYLDDFGPGIWYGGDLQKVRENHKIKNITNQELRDITTELQYNVDRVSKSAYRSTDGLNDWYYQAHLGFSYFLFSK